MARSSTTDVDPLPGLAPWVGGKNRLARRLVARIEAIPHTCYAEPFVGMGGVFFRRRRRPKVEVINDLGGDVFNLFRTVKHHGEAFLTEVDWMLAGRDWLDLVTAQDPATLTEIQRAARFFVWQSLCFSGRPGNRSFSAARFATKGRDPRNVRRRLRAAHRRLGRVTIENLGYQDFIARYDRPGCLFYLDPPYWGQETLYGKGLFSRADFQALADQLGGIKGRFLLSLNDGPEVRRTFARFKMEGIETIYTAAGGNHTKRVTELIISGPPKRRSKTA